MDKATKQLVDRQRIAEEASNLLKVIAATDNPSDSDLLSLGLLLGELVGAKLNENSNLKSEFIDSLIFE